MRSQFSEIMTLTKVGLLNSFGISSIKSRANEKRRTTIIMIIALIAVIPSFGLIFWQMAEALEAFGRLDLLIYMGVLAISIMTIVFTVYRASGYLFDFKDYDLLTSLPVRNSSILISKLTQLYLSEQVFALIFGLIIIVIYAVKAAPGVTFYAAAILLFPFLTVVPMLLGTLLGYLVSIAASKTKKTNLVSYIGMAAMIVFVFVMQYYLQNLVLLQNAPTYFEDLLKYYPVGLMYIDAMLKSDLTAVVLYLAINIALLVLFVSVLSKSFKRINSRLNEKFARSNYKMKELKTSTALVALYKKEIRTYFGSVYYCFNTIFGMVLYIAFAVLVFFFGRETIVSILEIPDAANMLTPISFAVAGFTIAMTLVTSVSISIEGKSLWILKHLPLSFRTISLSKILLNLTITVPAFLLGAPFIAIALNMSAVNTALFVITGIVLSLFFPVLGLVINLKLPKLDWKSQMHVVKQSASMMMSTIISMLIVAAACIVATTGIDFELYVIILDILFAVASVVLWVYLQTKGERTFTEL